MLEDLRIFKPTYMSIVPRLLTRIEALIKGKIKELSPEEQDKVNQIIEYKIKEQAKHDGAKGLNAAFDQYPPYKFYEKLLGMIISNGFKPPLPQLLLLPWYI